MTSMKGGECVAILGVVREKSYEGEKYFRVKNLFTFHNLTQVLFISIIKVTIIFILYLSKLL